MVWFTQILLAALLLLIYYTGVLLNCNLYLYCKIAHSMYKFGLSLCLTVCLFVSNKRQKVGTDWARNLCGNSQDPGEGLWTVKIEKFCLEI